MSTAPPVDPGADADVREWAIVECLDAFRDEHGRPGQHKVAVSDLAALYTRTEALDELAQWQCRHPSREFSMRRMTPVRPVLDALVRQWRRRGTSLDGSVEA